MLKQFTRHVIVGKIQVFERAHIPKTRRNTTCEAVVSHHEVLQTWKNRTYVPCNLTMYAVARHIYCLKVGCWMLWQLQRTYK
uniref:Uncharacterized protein n=1 Tax=Populus trichocarpa TaxID=3694 RepID=A0A3N7EXG2_POPTR